MQFLTSLMGGSGNTVLNAVLALGIVLILIFLALWALRVVMKASNNVVRGGRKRLAVVDILPVDGKRQLIIIRRDNVEHLVMTGGPQDLVVESGIHVETQQPARPGGVPLRRPAPPQAQPPQAFAPAAAPQAAPVQRAPAPQRAAPAEAPIPSPSNDHAPVRGPLDRLRDLGRNSAQRPPASLRHTGLMRPVSRMEPGMIPSNADNSDQPSVDSATTGRVMPFGGTREDDGQRFGDDSDGQQHRDDGY